MSVCKREWKRKRENIWESECGRVSENKWVRKRDYVCEKAEDKIEEREINTWGCERGRENIRVREGKRSA